MWERIRRLFTRKRPVRRWSERELEMKKRELEARDPNHFTTADRLEVIEWIVQRYYPEDGELFEADFQRAQETWRKQIEESQKNPTPALPTENHSPPPTGVGFGEFEAIIAPLLRRTEYLPSRFVEADPERFLRDLFRVCSSPDYGGWAAQSVMFDNYATENLDFHTLTIAASGAIANFERLTQAKADSYTTARGMIPLDELCPIALHQIDGQEYPIDDLLAAYDDPDGGTPILPHPDCPNFQHDGGGWCRCAWVPTRKSAPPGVDPEFAARLEEIFGAEHRAAEEQARRAFLERLRGDAVVAEKRIAEAQNALEAARRTPPALTPELMADYLKIDELRRMQRQNGLPSCRKKVDIAAHLMAEPVAQADVAAVLTRIHDQAIKESEYELNCALARLETIKQQIATYEAAWGINSEQE